MKEALIALVEGLREVSQDNFSQFLDLGDDDAGGIAPTILALAQGWERLAGRVSCGGWGGGGGACVSPLTGRRCVLPAFAAEATVGVAFGAALLVVAVAHKGLEIVLPDPGNDVLSVEGDDVAKVDGGGQRIGNTADGSGQEKLKCAIVKLAQDAAKLLATGNGAFRVKTPGLGWVGDEWKARRPDQRRVLDEMSAQLLEGGEMLFQFDQIGGDKGCAWRWRGARPGAVGGSFGEMLPVIY